MSEQERGEMVDSEGDLVALHGQPAFTDYRTGVVQQQVKSVVLGGEFSGESVDVLEISEVALHQFERITAGRLSNNLERRLTARRVAADHHDVSARAREPFAQFEPDAGIASGDQRDLPLHSDSPAEDEGLGYQSVDSAALLQMGHMPQVQPVGE